MCLLDPTCGYTQQHLTVPTTLDGSHNNGGSLRNGYSLLIREERGHAGGGGDRCPVGFESPIRPQSCSQSYKEQTCTRYAWLCRYQAIYSFIEQ